MWELFDLMDADGGDGGSVAVAPAPPAPAAAPATVVATPAAPAASPAPAADGFWKDGWRERLAGGDEKALAQLARFASPEDVWKKTRNLEARFSSGEFKPTLPKNAKPEEIAAYRQAHGIPEKPEGYDLKDIKLDDADKGLMAKVTAAAHGVNASPEVVKAVAGVWPQIKAEVMQAQAAKDVELKTQSEDTLRQEWGGEFRRNMGLIHQLFDSTGSQELKDNFLNGRLADGTPIGSSPEALKMILGVALKDNPAGVVVPGGGADPVGTINDEISKIEEKMRIDRKAYDRDEKMQARYRDLLNAREKQQARK